MDSNAIDISRGRHSQAMAFDVLKEKADMTGGYVDRSATLADARHGSFKKPKAEIPQIMGARETVPQSIIERFSIMMGGQEQAASKMNRKRSSLV